MLVQNRPQPDPKTAIGSGKLQDLMLRCFQADVDLVIFDDELSAVQARNLAERLDLRVIDRTQLILDIFAQRANTRDGKLQVELAQLQYVLPRLAQRDTSLSRLGGGIGGRGPGETQLEIDRRRVRERITRLERDLRLLERQRAHRRARRARRGLPGALDRRLHERGQEHAAADAHPAPRRWSRTSSSRRSTRPRAACASRATARRS